MALDQATRDAMQAAFAAVGRPPVVLQATPSLETDAVETAALWAAEAVAIAGGRSVVAASRGPVDRLNRIGAIFQEAPLDGRGPVAASRAINRLRRLIDEHGVDIVHARNRDIASAARQACRGTKAVLMTSCGGDSPFVDAHRDGGAALEGACIVAGSAHVRDVIARADPAKADRIAVIPDGVDTSAYAADAISAERLGRLARGWGMLEEPSPTILAPGPIEPLRGQHVLARALGPVAAEPELRDVVVIVAGEAGRRNSYATQLAWIVKRGGTSGRVFLSPRLDDLPAALLLADVIVSLPTDPLGQDPTAAAALALGKPIVGANHGATAEVIGDDAGRRVPPLDDAAVAASLKDILTMPGDERTALAERARARAETYFSAKAAALATIRLYGALLTATRS